MRSEIAAVAASKGNADAHVVGPQESDRGIVQERGVGLDAEEKIACVTLNAGKDGLAVQQRLGPVEDDLRQAAVRHRGVEVVFEDRQGAQQVVLRTCAARGGASSPEYNNRCN